MKTYLLTKSEPNEAVVHVKYCDSFWQKFRGLMFTRELSPDEGIIMVEDAENKLNTTIHMFFMFFDITVLWLDQDLVIVDKVLAKKWRPYYAPKAPAQYVVELHASRFEDFAVGEKLALSAEDVTPHFK
jgi:hypothetical protein